MRWHVCLKKKKKSNPEVAWTSLTDTQERRSHCYWNVGHSRICFICLIESFYEWHTFMHFLLKETQCFHLLGGRSETCIKEITGYDLFITGCQCFRPVRWYLMRGLSKGRRFRISADALGEYSLQGHVLLLHSELDSKTSWRVGMPFEHFLW